MTSFSKLLLAKVANGLQTTVSVEPCYSFTILDKIQEGDVWIKPRKSEAHIPSCGSLCFKVFHNEIILGSSSFEIECS